MMNLLQEARLALRTLGKSRTLAAAAIGTLAIAVAANTLIFSLVEAFLLRPLPFPDPNRLVDIKTIAPAVGGLPARPAFVGAATLSAWRDNTQSLAGLAAYRTASVAVIDRAEPYRVLGSKVTASLFPVLGVEPAFGRVFLEEEERASAPVVVISNRLWQRSFQGDPTVIGEAVQLDGSPHTVIGVMPDSLAFPPGVDLWTPLSISSAHQRTPELIRSDYFAAVGRLKPGISTASVQSEGDAILVATTEDVQPSGAPSRLVIAPLHEALVTDVKPVLFVLWAAVALLLVVASINVASLLLVRTKSREREFAIRRAIGAQRPAIIRLVLLESMLLSLMGGAVGWLLAYSLQAQVPRIFPHQSITSAPLNLDGRVAVFCLLLCALSGIVAGVFPALAGASVGSESLQPAGNATTWRRRVSRQVFVVAEIALAFTLLVGAGLLLRSFAKLLAVDLGFEPVGVLAVTLDPGKNRPGGWDKALLDELLTRLKLNPDVEAVGVVTYPPLTPTFSVTTVTLEGAPSGPAMAVPQVTSPGYLATMRLRLREGRWLSPDDLAIGAPFAVVNKTFAQRYIASGSPVGTRAQVGTASFEIVGVIDDVHLLGPHTPPRPELFTLYSTASGTGPQPVTLVARARNVDPSKLVGFVRSTVLELIPDIPLDDLNTLPKRVSESLAQRRSPAVLLGTFAASALALAGMGVYGMLSFWVARQERAFGIRKALGAQPSQIVFMILRKAFAMLAAGLAIGTFLGIAGSRSLEHLLFGVVRNDVFTYSAAFLIITVIVLVASYVPARQGLRANPADLLRLE